MARPRFWDVCLGVVQTGESFQLFARAVRDNRPYLYVPSSVVCTSLFGFAEQWSDQSPTFGSSCFPVFGSSGGEMESGGGFTDDCLDPKADFGGTVAIGLRGIFEDADFFVGGADGCGFGWFCSPQFLVCMGSVDGVLG